jgi:hypothetical protein
MNSQLVAPAPTTLPIASAIEPVPPPLKLMDVELDVLVAARKAPVATGAGNPLPRRTP